MDGQLLGRGPGHGIDHRPELLEVLLHHSELAQPGDLLPEQADERYFLHREPL